MTKAKRPIKIARVSTIPFFVYSQLGKQLLDLQEKGFDVTVISKSNNELREFLEKNKINFIEINIERQVNLLKDLSALLSLIKVFRKNKFDIIHSTTPKAGLISALAGLIANSPIRVHTFTGQIWTDFKGFKRDFYKFIDWLIIKINTRCLVDGHSQREYLFKNAVVTSVDKIDIIGEGSLSGVDIERFSVDSYKGEKELIKETLGITENIKLILYLGRLTEDKGIFELLLTLNFLNRKEKKYGLIIVGPQDFINKEHQKKFQDIVDRDNMVFSYGYTSNPEKFYFISDLLCLLSYREGFGTVIIEAAAMGKPAIASKVTGLIDSIKDGVTGILVDNRNPENVAQEINNLLSDSKRYDEISKNARQRAIEKFNSNKHSCMLAKYYYYLLNKNNNKEEAS